jgi:hypothetical protein
MPTFYFFVGWTPDPSDNAETVSVCVTVVSMAVGWYARVSWSGRSFIELT